MVKTGYRPCSKEPTVCAGCNITSGMEKYRMKNEYMKRQMFMLSNLGLFYVILLALFGIPLFGTFVVVFIKGVLDFRYLILGGGILVLSLMIFYMGKFGFRAFGKIKRDGLIAIEDARSRAEQGQPVRLELLGGMVSLSCGTGNRTEALPYHGGETPLLLAETPQPAVSDPVRQLRELAALKADGIIDAEEFRLLKEKLIRDVCALPDQEI